MILTDLVAAYQAQADLLGFPFRQGALTEIIDIPSNADEFFIWMDRPVNFRPDKVVYQTKQGQIDYTIDIHSLEVHTQDLQATEPFYVAWDRNTKRLIDIVGDVSLANNWVAKSITTPSPGFFESSVHQGKYIGLYTRITFRMDYCE